ncbi:MAG: DUF1573 domain-containing protein [Candidatus Dadabacteria bacterium]|nr:MAG: DUF1573 domain-containing protein [Candidatus Dadabacteria bacterium]
MVCYRRALCGLILLVCCLSISASAEEEKKLPKLEIPNAEYDFGSVSQGTVVSHDFLIKNKGNAPLVIQRIVPACGCTASTLEKNRVAPGEETVVHVEFDTSGFSGEKYKTVRLYSNDFDQPSALLALKGVVEPDVIVEPRRVYFGEVVKGVTPADLSRIVVVKVRKGSGAKITSVSTFSDVLNVEELFSSPSEKRLKISLSDTVRLGELRDRVIVGIKGSRINSINIPVFASVKGPIRLRPATVSFGILDGKEKISRQVKLENRGKNLITVKKIVSSNPAVTANFSEIKKGRLYVINISVDPAAVKEDLRASLNILTDSPEEKPLSLSVYGIRPPRL